MRTIYDQFSQPENRLTHALACTLTHNRSLIRPFLRWLGIRDVPHARSLRIVEQQVPGELVSRDESESDGLPDMCVFDDDGWAVLFELKVAAAANRGQIERHRRTAARHGYEGATVVVITVTPLTIAAKHVLTTQWSSLWSWFRRRSNDSFWARQLVLYMQAFETRMLSQDYSIHGTITMFDGIHFDEQNPYTYSEAKRLIRLMGDRLQTRKDLHRIGVDPKGARRSSITGRNADFVWDFLPLKAARGRSAFTHAPHLTMGISRTDIGATITVPNSVKGGFRTRLRNLGEEGFCDLLRDIHERLGRVYKKSRNARPQVYALQRHFLSQRSGGIDDGRVTADLRTLISGSQGGVKYQPQWIDAIYKVLTEKRSNIQFGVGVLLSHDCPLVRSEKALDLMADSWNAMRPVLDLVLKRT